MQHSQQQLPVALQLLLQRELAQVCLESPKIYPWIQSWEHEGSALVCSADVPQSRGEACKRRMRTPLSYEKGTNFSVGFILARDKF